MRVMMRAQPSLVADQDFETCVQPRLLPVEGYAQPRLQVSEIRRSVPIGGDGG